MENSYKKMVNISDIAGWLYCPRKVYITKVKKIKMPPTKEMIVGKIKHNILELFSKNEEKIVLKIDRDYDNIDLVFMYEEFIKEIASRVFYDNHEVLEGFRINADQALRKIIEGFSEDIRIRVIELKKKMKEGFFGNELWNNLEVIYISELPVESENYGLRGRVDRIEVDKINNKIIPFELKTREGGIFHADDIQLTAYAMLLEEKYNRKIKFGIIESGNKKEEREITEENKQEVLEIADTIRKLDQGIIPAILSNFNKCKSCAFNEVCLDA
jgi:CRISPR-associated exonuclease Cas4